MRRRAEISNLCNFPIAVLVGRIRIGRRGRGGRGGRLCQLIVEVGRPEFGQREPRPALFGGTMLFRSPEKRSYQLFDLGAQVDLGFTVVMRLPMVFSVGVAHGFGDKDVDGQTEWLASLKIM